MGIVITRTGNQTGWIYQELAADQEALNFLASVTPDPGPNPTIVPLPLGGRQIDAKPFTADAVLDQAALSTLSDINPTPVLSTTVSLPIASIAVDVADLQAEIAQIEAQLAKLSTF